MINVNNIKTWPREDRPREKLLDRGASALTEAELLAILIRNGERTSGKTALDQARVLLNQFGSLKKLGEATTVELCAVKGIGPAKAAALFAALELGRRFATTNLVRDKMVSSSQDVYNHYGQKLRYWKKELFFSLLLDGKNRVMEEVTVSIGSLTATQVHPREVFHAALRASAAGIILVHNHPSGDPIPSLQDREITDRLCEAGKLLGIPVLDHIIVGDTTYWSFRDHGAIPE